MTYVPNGTVKLCSVPAIDTHNSLYFDSETAKETYFNSKVVKTYSKVSYIRRSRAIKLDITYSELLQCNYIMFQNQPLSTQWIYAKIVNYEMINFNCYSIKFAIDTWMTWQNKITFKESYVKRHTIKKSEDVAGKNILAENFDFSSYVWDSESFKSLTSSNTEDTSSYYLIIESLGFILNDNAEPPVYTNGSTLYNRVPINTVFLFFSVSAGGIAKFKKYIDQVSKVGKIREILSIFYAPKDLFTDIPFLRLDQGQPAGLTGDGRDYYEINIFPGDSLVSGLTKFNSSHTGDTPTYWTPKNNKLFTFPYLRFVMTDLSGSTVYLKPELMVKRNNNFHFFVDVNLPSPHSIVVYPLFYDLGTYQNGIELNNLVEISASVDSSEEYLALHRNMIGFQQYSTNINKIENRVNAGYKTAKAIGEIFSIAQDTGKAIIGMGDASDIDITQRSINASQNFVQAGFDFIKSDFPERQLEAQLSDVELMPNNSQGTRTPGIDKLYHGKSDIYCYYEHLPISQLKLIDDYFSKFGYNISQFKPVTFHNRTQWEYYETSNISIEGDVPENELEIIKGLFNNGFRVWYNPANFLNYSLANN